MNKYKLQLLNDLISHIDSALYSAEILSYEYEDGYSTLKDMIKDVFYYADRLKEGEENG